MNEDLFFAICLNVPNGTKLGERCFTSSQELIDFIKSYPEGAVFSVIYERNDIQDDSNFR